MNGRAASTAPGSAEGGGRVHPGAVFGALASSDERLRVFAAVVLGAPATVADVAAAAGLEVAATRRALAALERVGLLGSSSGAGSGPGSGSSSGSGSGPSSGFGPPSGSSPGSGSSSGADPTWSPVVATLRSAAAEASRLRRPPDPTDLGASEEVAALLRGYFTDGRLTHLPSQEAKRLLVLDFVVQRFEPGRRYPEGEVNRLLGEVASDHATLRRALVDAGYLERRDGRYWRAGGTFEV